MPDTLTCAPLATPTITEEQEGAPVAAVETPNQV